MTDSPRTVTGAIRHCLLNPAALAYLALVAAVCVWVGVDHLFVDHADATFSGVWAFFATAPTSLLALALSGPLLWVGIGVAAVIQAAVLGAVYRRLTQRPRQHAGAGHA